MSGLWLLVAAASASSESAPVCITSSLTPSLHVRKTLAGGLSVGCTYDADGQVDVQSTIKDKYTGGKFKLTNLRKLEWNKLVLLPGLLDSATKVELRSSVDLHTGKPAGEIKLGLRRRARDVSSGLGLVHRVELPQLRGCCLDLGATLVLPEELKLGTTGGAGLRELAKAARVDVDIDTLELIVDLDEVL